MRAVNLIPGDQRQGAGSFTGRSGGGALIVLAALAGLAALLAMYGSAHHQISSQAGEAARLDAQTSAVEARTGRLAPYTSFVAMAGQRTSTVSQLVKARFDWSHALHELGRVLPAGTSLSTLHGAVGSTSSGSASVPATPTGATPASSTPPGSTPVFSLTGCAKSQSIVAQTLQRLRLMDGASEVQLQSSTKSSAGSGSAAASSSGGCQGGDPAFSVQIVFAALPGAPAAGAPAGAASPASASVGASAQPAAAQGTAVSK